MKALAIDGGGIRGLIPALVLAEIERRTGRRIDRKSTRLNSSHTSKSRMPSSA